MRITQIQMRMMELRRVILPLHRFKSLTIEVLKWCLLEVLSKVKLILVD